MKAKLSAYILLVIGILGIIASGINYFYGGDSISDVLLTLICSVALLFGYTEIKKLDKE